MFKFLTVAMLAAALIEASYGELFWGLFTYCIGVACLWRVMDQLAEAWTVKIHAQRKTCKGQL